MLLLSGPLVWLAVLGVWASQPLIEHMVVGEVDGRSVAQRIECNSPLSRQARDVTVAVPVLADGFGYPREPCERTHRNTQAALVLNLVLAGGVAAAGVGVLVRRPETADDTALTQDA